MKRVLLLIALLCSLTPASFAAQGSGNPVLSVSNSSLAAEGTKTITVTGRDYLVPPHAPGNHVFGGVYLFFGWVAGGDWGPSARNSQNNNGTFGVSYAYPGDGGDPSTRGDQGGTMRFISFTSGGASGETTDYHMNDNGDWSAPLKINGYTFTTESSSGTKTYNCRQVQCGVFTIGAHGIASKTNEKFTPINFAPAKTPTPEPTVATPKPTIKPATAPSNSPGGASPTAKPASSNAPAVAGSRATATPKPKPNSTNRPRRTAGSTTTSSDDPRATTGATTLPVELSRPSGSPSDAFASGASSDDGGGGSGGAFAIVGGVGGLSLAGIAGAVAFQRRRRRMEDMDL